MTYLEYDPNRLLDTLMRRLGLASDKALSRKLRIAGKVLARIRAGCIPIGASMLIWISEATGIGVAELRKILGDRRARFRLNVARPV